MEGAVEAQLAWTFFRRYSISFTATASLFELGSLNKPMDASSMRLMMGLAEQLAVLGRCSICRIDSFSSLLALPRIVWVIVIPGCSKLKQSGDTGDIGEAKDMDWAEVT